MGRRLETTPLQDERFLLLSTLGEGGMARVFRAFDRFEQRFVALKVGSEPARAGPGHPLAAEFDAWTRLRHPNIVRAYEMGVAQRGPLPAGAPYLVLEHVSGRPAHRALTPGFIEVGDLERFAVQVLRGLHHVHRARLVHRDLKPANVLVSPGRRLRVKIADFGLATRAGSRGAPGVVNGSLPYVAPETLIGLPVDGRADLYGLGVLLYQLAVGELPVPRGSAKQLLRWHLEGRAADPRRVRPRFSPRLARFIRRLTARRPEQRPANVVQALEILGARSSRDAGPSRREPSTRETTALRLALDAARLGAFRTHRLPPHPQVRAGLIRRIRVWCEIRGVRWHELEPSPPPSADRLARLVVRLVAEGGDAALDALRRSRLERWLGLRMLGDLPMATEQSSRLVPLRLGRRELAAAGSSMARFLLAWAERRTLVLCLNGVAPGPSLLGPLLHELHLATSGCSRTGSVGGGLLVLFYEKGAGRRSISPSATARGRPGRAG